MDGLRIHHTMSPSITNAFSEFATALMGIAFSLFHSVVAVTQAILALGIDIVHNILTLGRSVIKLAFDLFQGVFGFVAGW